MAELHTPIQSNAWVKNDQDAKCPEESKSNSVQSADRSYRDLRPADGSYRETTAPLEHGSTFLPHFLDQFGDQVAKELEERHAERHARTDESNSTLKGRRSSVVMSHREIEKDKIKVYAALSVNELRDIHPANESFQIRVRLYLVWRPKLIGRCAHSAAEAREAFGGFVDKAEAKFESTGAKWVTLTSDEYDDLSSKVRIPEISFPSTVGFEEIDQPTVRVYSSWGGVLLWNRAYTIDHSHTYDLRRFPFDYHDLAVRLCQNNSQTWDIFDLTVCSVQFHRDALLSAEWEVFKPTLAKSSAKNSTVHLHIRRVSTYYVQNVVGIMSALALVGFTIFAQEEPAVLDRINTLITLLLTAVAFKFAISDSMPKVGYNTTMDRFFLFNMTVLFLLVIVSTIWSLLKDSVDESFVRENCTIGGVKCTLNNHLCVGSFIFFIALNAVWVLSILLGAGKAPKVKYGMKRGKNWFGSQFATPLFLPVPTRTRKYPKAS